MTLCAIVVAIVNRNCWSGVSGRAGRVCNSALCSVAATAGTSSVVNPGMNTCEASLGRIILHFLLPAR